MSSLPRDDLERGRSGRKQKNSQHPRHDATHRIHEAHPGGEDVLYQPQAYAQPSQGQLADHFKGKTSTPVLSTDINAPSAFDLMGSVFSPTGKTFVTVPDPILLSSTPETIPANDLRQVPQHFDGCAESAADHYDTNLPPSRSLPPPGQPPSEKEHVPKPSIVYDPATQARIAAFDKDTQTLIMKYGGFPLENQKQVLSKVETWQATYKQNLMTVVRKDGLKGGVVHVTCNACLLLKPDAPEEAQHKTVQKAAEHIISFHWELSIWACISGGCDKKFRRKQECDRHEETHGIITKKKEKRLMGQTEAPPPAPEKAVQSEKSATALTRSRIRRNESKVTLLAPPGSVSGGPERPSRSRDSSPHRRKPYDNLRATHSTPDLSTATATVQASTSRRQTVPYVQKENPSPYPPPALTTSNPVPRFTLTDTSGGFRPLFNPATAVIPSWMQMPFPATQNIQVHPRPAAAVAATPLPYPQFPSYLPLQGQHVAQARITPSSNGTMHPQGQVMPSPYGLRPSYDLPLMDSYDMSTSQLDPQFYAPSFDVGTAGADQIPPQSTTNYGPNDYDQWLASQQHNYDKGM